MVPSKSRQNRVEFFPLNRISQGVIILLIFAGGNIWAKDAFSGKIHYNWSYDFTEEADGYNAFSISRMYFGYEKQLDDNIKIKLVTDVIAPKNDNAWFLYQKYAYLQWNTSIGELLFGLQGMNIFNITEKNWGYRFVEKSSMDLHKFGSSADMGVGIKKTIADMFHIHITATNGGGYKKMEQDKYKKLAIQAVAGELNLPKNTGYNVGLVMASQPYDYGVTDTTEGEKKSTTVLSVFGGFAQDNFQIGGEFDLFTDNGTQTTTQIAAIYGDFSLGKQLKLFGRIENIDPDTDTIDNVETLIIAGVDYAAGKGFNIAPNIRYSAPENGDSELLTLVFNFLFKF